MRLSRKAIPAVLVALALGFWTSIEPALHAGRVEAHDLSLPEQIFADGASAEARIKQRPFEERSPEEYPRAIDLFRQVTELGGNADLRDRARMRMADLTREMALRTGDARFFEQAIDIYRQLVIDRPDSPFLGEALVSIAETYEYELQDIDGATAAYRDLARRFPQSVSGREAEANLARLDPASSGGAAGTDIIGTVVAPGAEIARTAEDAGADSVRVVNIRSFAGPDYARIVVDLSRPAAYREQRDGARVTYRLPGVELSDSLLGRRLATVRGSLLKQMRVEQFGDGVAITLDVATLESAAAFLLEDPNRLIIDLRGVTPRIAGVPGARPSLDPRLPGGVPGGVDVSKLAPDAASAPDIVAPPAPIGPEAIPDALAGPRPVHCIVIDPGHGGHDTGTIGPGGLSEKDVCLDIARRLRASLRAELPGVEIILTRDGDRFVSLEERTAIANARNADLFISVHANASQSKETSGVETFVLDPNAVKKEGEADPELAKAKRASQVYASVGFGASSRALAGHVQGSLVRGISARNPKAARDRGIKHASFAVLRGARMPSVLVEVSFVSNPEDENRLRTPAFRQRIASSLTAGVRSYVRAVGSS